LPVSVAEIIEVPKGETEREPDESQRSRDAFEVGAAIEG
jgi:hypothetical protein